MEFNIAHSSLILLFEGLFLAGAVLQVFFYFYFYMRLAFYRKEKSGTHKPPVSVIIAARNEYENLANNLPSILKQVYPDFEVVVVDDGSWDDTEYLLKDFQKEYAHLRIVKGLGDAHPNGGKKLAITLAIKGAKYDRLLFTDADCRPESPQWIAGMMESVKEEETIVLGYSPYERKSGFLNALIRFEAYYTALNYFSFALSGNPYMGVGRNLSYSKGSFFGIGGFKTHYSIATGDDDLFINEVADASNTEICLEKNAVVKSIPKETWKAYWFQKRRHLYAGWRYKLKHKVLLAVQPISFFLFLVASIFLLVFNTWFYIVVLTLSFRVLLQFFIFRRSSRWLGQRDLIFLAPFLEIIVVVMSGFLHIANATAKPKKWRN